MAVGWAAHPCPASSAHFTHNQTPSSLVMPPMLKRRTSSMHQGEDLALERLRDYVYTRHGKKSHYNCDTFQLNDDAFLRFLRARDFDLERAVTMLEAHLAFREQWKPHMIVSTEERILHGLTAHGGFWRIIGQSKQGSIVQLFDLAKYDGNTYGGGGTTAAHDFTRLLLFHNETVKRECVRLGVDRTLIVFDYTHFSFAKHATPTALKLIGVLADVMQNHYPEFLECGVIFNAPRDFPLFWRLIKAFLHDKMKDKVKFETYRGESSSNNADVGLTKYIAPEFLLKKFGGSMTEAYYANPYDDAATAGAAAAAAQE